MYKYKITVFTPTYNRGHIIKNLYKSLKVQTFKNFEWIVIDDGSTDDTSEIFNKIKKENNDFKITFLKTENGGKHRAINKALDIAEGELFFIVDSDDYLPTNSLERINFWESTIADKEKFAGVAGNKGYDNNTIVGKIFEDEYVDATSLEREKLNISGDKAEVFYTNILKNNKFPEFYGENFITECVIWNKIAFEGYKLRWFNEIIYICDYLEDGLTMAGQKIFIDNPKGYAIFIRKEIEYKNVGYRKKIQLWFDYYIQLKEKLSLREMANNLEINKIILLFIVYGWKFKRILIRSFKNENN